VKLRNEEFKPKLSPEYFYCLLQKEAEDINFSDSFRTNKLQTFP